MAESSMNPLIAQLLADNTLRERVQSIISRNSPVQATAQDVEELANSERQYDDLSALLKMAVNGDANMSEQTVVVEYLRNEQRLILPGALGMTLTGEGRCRTNPTLRARFRKSFNFSYPQIKELVASRTSDNNVQATVDGMPVHPAAELDAPWRKSDWFVLADGSMEAEYIGDVIMGTFSSMLQFNCDIRDFGLLTQEGMSVNDDDWMRSNDVPLTRLKNRLMPHSLHMIASLNLPCVANCALAAWTRAFGVGIGLLPSTTSRSVLEMKWTTGHPPRDARRAVSEYSDSFERPMITLCSNLLAMFGLFHLNKDHTFKTNDANMDRIADSYLNTLRTDTTAENMSYMKQHVEALVRTAQHPFGLAQTYWLARVMALHTRLMSPLAVRLDTTPPPVQRLMICNAAAREWDGMPAGKAVSALYYDELATIRAEIAQIRKEPAHYSALARLYGYNEQMIISDAAKRCADAMMPAVYGYIVTTHTDDRNEKDGLGHALSLKNVERDMKGVVTTWKSAWEKYIHGLDQVGIAEFVTQIRDERAQLSQIAAGPSG